MEPWDTVNCKVKAFSSCIFPNTNNGATLHFHWEKEICKIMKKSHYSFTLIKWQYRQKRWDWNICIKFFSSQSIGVLSAVFSIFFPTAAMKAEGSWALAMTGGSPGNHHFWSWQDHCHAMAMQNSHNIWFLPWNLHRDPQVLCTIIGWHHWAAGRLCQCKISMKRLAPSLHHLLPQLDFVLPRKRKKKGGDMQSNKQERQVDRPRLFRSQVVDNVAWGRAEGQIRQIKGQIWHIICAIWWGVNPRAAFSRCRSH